MYIHAERHRKKLNLTADGKHYKSPAPKGHLVNSVGANMLSTGEGGYLLPFEAVSVLLLACIVGALLIARKR